MRVAVLILIWISVNACMFSHSGVKIPMEKGKDTLVGLTYAQLIEKFGLPANPGDRRRSPGEPSEDSQAMRPSYLQYSFSSGYLIVLYTSTERTNYTFVLVDGRVQDVYEHPSQKSSGISLFGVFPPTMLSGDSGSDGGGRGRQH